MILSTVRYFLYIFMFFNTVNGILVRKCSQGDLMPEEVIVDGCNPDANICPVPWNGMFNMTIKFHAPHYLESMKPKLIAKTDLGNLELTEESLDQDVCKGILNTFCPLVEKEFIEYRYSIKLTVMPWIPITMEFSILDLELNEIAICFDVDVVPRSL